MYPSQETAQCPLCGERRAPLGRWCDVCDRLAVNESVSGLFALQRRLEFEVRFQRWLRTHPEAA